MDRRDLLTGVNSFFSDSIVLPPGEFDKELLLPIIETAKMKKNSAYKRSAGIKNENSDQPNTSLLLPEQKSTQSPGIFDK